MSLVGSELVLWINLRSWSVCCIYFHRVEGLVQGREIWKCIVNGSYIPTKVVDGVKVKNEEEEFDREDDRLYTLNLTAMNLLYNTLNGNEFNRIMNCATAKEIWDNLEVTYEGTLQVKESKIYILTHEYEILTVLGKVYSKVEIVRKILNSLPKRWKSKVTAILEVRDLKKLEVNELIGSLITHVSDPMSTH
ncbi:hypothetical protein I3760_16G077100 [Carya illinoinensis]|nr:hypothetical protein I3760_16G077100 [Carya illinoinensis]